MHADCDEREEDDFLLLLWVMFLNVVLVEEVGENSPKSSPPSVLSDPGERGEKALRFAIKFVTAKVLRALPIGIGVGPVLIPSSVETRQGLRMSEEMGVESHESSLRAVRSVKILAVGESGCEKVVFEDGVDNFLAPCSLARFLAQRDTRRRRTEGLMFEGLF